MRGDGFAARRKEDALNPEPHGIVSGTGRRLVLADAHGAQYDEAVKSLDAMARDYYGTSDACRELLAPDPARTSFPTYQAAADTAIARALLIEAAIGCGGGGLGSYVDSAQALDTDGQILRKRSTPEAAGEWESIAAPVAAAGGVAQANSSPTTGFRP